jgi:hypothetical protein
MLELHGVLERRVGQLAGGVPGDPASSEFDRSADADGGVSLGRHERTPSFCAAVGAQPG